MGFLTLTGLSAKHETDFILKQINRLLRFLLLFQLESVHTLFLFPLVTPEKLTKNESQGSYFSITLQICSSSLTSKTRRKQCTAPFKTHKINCFTVNNDDACSDAAASQPFCHIFTKREMS